MYVWCVVHVWLVSGSCMFGVRFMYGWCLVHVWLVSGSCMVGVCDFFKFPANSEPIFIIFISKYT